MAVKKRSSKDAFTIKERVEPQTEAIEVEPFELITSETTLIVYGNLSLDGITGSSALSAKAPCPISRLLGEPILPVSPVA